MFVTWGGLLEKKEKNNTLGDGYCNHGPRTCVAKRTRHFRAFRRRNHQSHNKPSKIHPSDVRRVADSSLSIVSRRRSSRSTPTDLNTKKKTHKNTHHLITHSAPGAVRTNLGRASRSGLVTLYRVPPPQLPSQPQAVNKLHPSDVRRSADSSLSIASRRRSQHSINKARTQGRNVVHPYSRRRHATSNSTPTTG